MAACGPTHSTTRRAGALRAPDNATGGVRWAARAPGRGAARGRGAGGRRGAVHYLVGARGMGFREDTMLSNLEMLLWLTVAHCANCRLRKIRIVHGALIRRCDIVELGAGVCEQLEHGRRMRFWANRTVDEKGAWRVEEDAEEGWYRLVKGQTDGQAGREVVLLFGETIREAEMYREVQKELLQEITDEEADR